jgi:branched-chain amino acid transport system substrate-binding protein
MITQRHLLTATTALIFSLTAQVSISVAQNAPVKIGATLSLSGKLAFSGTATQQGLQLAVEDINARGGISGRQIELVLEDNTGDPKLALTGIDKLFEYNKIDILFSSFSHITQAIKERVKRTGKIMIYAASVGEIAKESPLFFRDWGDADSQGASLSKAVSEAGHKRIGFLSESSEGCLAITKSFKAECERRGISITTEETYAPGETDFRSLLLRISQKKPQALATCTWRDASIIMPQLKNMGLIALPMFQFFAPFIPASDTHEVRKLYEENKTVAIWIGFIEGSLNNEQKAFFDRLKSKFNSSPRIESALAYDDLMVLEAAISACPSKADLDQACIAKQMLETKYVGIAGPLNFDEFGRSNRPDLLVKIKDGVWVDATK